MLGLVAVGYIERFNPAVRKLRELLDLAQICSSFSIRYGPGSPRITDIGVLQDMGSHEIDMLNYLYNEDPKLLHVNLYNNNADVENRASVLLEYGNRLGHVEVSWIPNYKLRNLFIYEEDH